MGVFGLTGYVDRKSNFWEDVWLRNTKVVIDGNSLYHGLYFNSQLDCRSGGQYQQFHDNLRSFFEQFKLNRVQPYVILDGPSSVEKFDTIKERMKQSISRTWSLANGSDPQRQVRPLLLRRTFIQTLDEIGVKFAVCDGEADQEIASLAAKWECPVISNDSDFFIFDLNGGYIPLKFLDWRSGQPKAKLFRVEKLSAHLKIQKELLPLVASLLGNDFVSDDVREPLYTALGIYDQRNVENKASSIGNHFRRENVGSLREGVRSVLRLVTGRRDELDRALETSINSYKVHDSKLAAYFENGQVHSKLKSQRKVPVEPWVLRSVRHGLFPTTSTGALTTGVVFFRPQVEDFNSASANQCSIELRRFVYGILGNGAATAVTEWERHRTELQGHTVKPSHYVHGFGELPSLRTIPDLGDAERRKLCLSLLESNTDPILSLPAESQLFAASVHYWMKHAQPAIKESHVRALLMNTLVLVEVSSSPCARPFDLAVQHSFAQWQSVMREVVNLNLILQEPLPTPRIRQLYDGLLLQSLVSDLESGRNIPLSRQSSDEFRRLYHAVKTSTSGPSADRY